VEQKDEGIEHEEELNKEIEELDDENYC